MNLCALKRREEGARADYRIFGELSRGRARVERMQLGRKVFTLLKCTVEAFICCQQPASRGQRGLGPGLESL